MKNTGILIKDCSNMSVVIGGEFEVPPITMQSCVGICFFFPAIFFFQKFEVPPFTMQSCVGICFFFYTLHLGL